MTDEADKSGNAPEVEDETAQHHRREHTDQKGDLAGDELVFDECGNGESDAECGEKVNHGACKNDEERSAERNVIDIVRGEEAKRESYHGGAEVGNDFGNQYFQRFYGTDEKGFQRAPFPFSGHDHGGKKYADKGHDENDKTGNKEPGTRIRIIKPLAWDDFHKTACRYDAALFFHIGGNPAGDS